MDKVKDYIPKVKKLEKDLELIDGKEDEEIDGIPKAMEKVMV